MQVAALAVAGAARADRNLFVGASGNPLRWEPQASVAVARELGVGVFRIADLWSPGETEPDPADAENLAEAVAAADGLRIAVSVYSPYGIDAPKTAAARDEYCTYVRNLIARYPISDVVIWIEPNKTQFWAPQFGAGEAAAAPAQYEAPLARCWDVLHAFRPDVNVIAPGTSPHGNDDPHARSNISESPGNFIRRMGYAYRASGRRRPLFDTVGHNAYGDFSAERPWRRHRFSTSISEGDWGKLMQALWDGFHGTAQPIPGRCVAGKCVPIWYLEIGYQTVPDASKRAEYTGKETDPHPLRAYAGGESRSARPAASSLAPDQATQIVDGVELAYCQPYVDAYFIFNLELWDDADLSFWQSAAFWVDRTPKPSLPFFQRAIAEVNDRTVDCRNLKGGPAPQRFRPRRGVGVAFLRIRRRSFRIRTIERARYQAWVGPLRLAGRLGLGYRAVVSIPGPRLAPGRYRLTLRLTSEENPERKSTFRGRFFTQPPRRR